MTPKDIIFILIAYLLGGICTGYYLVRIKTRLDIREQGSGGIGARNVGRVLGKSGFVITLLGDALKGVLAVALARKFEITPYGLSFALVAVVAGHIWPLSLQFQGGRGIATAIGAYLAYDLQLLLFLVGITLVMIVFRRGFILSGLTAFLLLPLVAYILDRPGYMIAAMAGLAIIILFAHRERLCKVFSETLPQREI